MFNFKYTANVLSKEIRDFLFLNKDCYYPNQEINYNDLRENLNVGSKVYECYFNDKLVAFIYLDFFEEENCYEIAFGKLSNDIEFFKILKEFLDEYAETKKIFAVVEASNPKRKKIYDILEKVGFKYNLDDCAGNERQFSPI